MTLDNLLSQPLPPVRDDGFSARMVLELRRREERRRLWLWGAVSLALLPLLALVPMTATIAMAQMARAASSPVFASAIGIAVLLWACRPAPARF